MSNYIGGNAFLEMGFAYILKKPIFLLNPIPKMPYYETEIIAMKPVILNGDLSKIINCHSGPGAGIQSLYCLDSGSSPE